MKTCFLLAFAVLVCAQEAPAPKASEADSRHAPEEKPSPRKKARELLDSAAEMLGAVQPQIQVVALMHLAENYQVFDNSKSLEYFKQAFAAAGVLPADAAGDQRADLQAQIASLAANVNLDVAAGLLKQITVDGNGADPRAEAILHIVGLLVQKDQIDQAMALVESAGSTGEYPFGASSTVMAKLPPGDARQVTVFGSAMAAFANRPNRGFAQLIAARWRDVPLAMAQSAVDSLVRWILDRKDAGFETKTLSSSRGTVTLGSRQAAELFDVMYVLRAVEPERAAEILEKYPDLRSALARFPEGTQSLAGKDGSISTSTTGSETKISADVETRQRLDGIAQSRADAALAAMSQDPRRALDMVRMIPVPAKQAEVLGRIAQGVSEKDPDVARQLLNQCVSVLDDIKDPRSRAGTWEIVAEAAHRIKDEERARQAIDRGMADSAEIYHADMDADNPNVALREYWPSTQNYRRIVAEAAKIFGVDAEPLLAKIQDPELALLARIEVAQVLLGRPRTQGRTSVSRRK